MAWKLDYTATAAERLGLLDEDPHLQLEVHRTLELFANNPRTLTRIDALGGVLAGRFRAKDMTGRTLVFTAAFRFSQDETSLVCLAITWVAA